MCNGSLIISVFVLRCGCDDSNERKLRCSRSQQSTKSQPLTFALACRKAAIAVALAWLLHFDRPSDPPPRWPFTNFWDALSIERDDNRQAAVQAPTNAIILTLGMTRHR
jgi:hypothetical protein